ncbi:MAG: MarR family winged helix-turn-helix transcriptional regulator [Mycobacteriales bacterium]
MAGDEKVAAWAALLRVHAAVVPLLEGELLQSRGLPLAWYDVLLELNAAEDHRLRMSELSERVVLSRSRVSRVVDELEQAGHVSRESDPSDGRSAFAVVTRSGRAALRAAAPVYLAAVERHVTSHLTDQEARQLAAALERVLEAAGGEPRPFRLRAPRRHASPGRT